MTSKDTLITVPEQVLMRRSAFGTAIWFWFCFKFSNPQEPVNGS